MNKCCFPFCLIQTSGPGRKLNSTDTVAGTSKPRHSDAYVPPSRSELTPEARAAADAALARVQNRANPNEYNTSIAAIRMQVKRELEAEKQAKALADGAGPSSASAGSATACAVAKENVNLAVQGVFFR